MGKKNSKGSTGRGWFGLGTRPEPALLRTSAQLRLEGYLLETALTQTYANTSTKPLELVYTFPLPFQAVFLGLQTQLGEQHAQGVILARRQAEATYEQALQDGDTPVMLELADDGLLTANLGNLAPGEELRVTLRWGQWLQLEQDRLRVVVPTVGAPRFGTPAVQPQQVSAPSLQAEYPLQLTFDVVGAFAAAEVACETHRVSTRIQDGVLQLTLWGEAALDRDVVFTLVPPPGQTCAGALHGPDATAGAGAHVALAALTLPPTPERSAVALRVLVDCSGSMAGDGMASARRALAQLASRLRPGDRVSYSRFGSTVEHDIAALLSCDAGTVEQLVQAIQATDATLGGTEMEAALQSVFGLPATPGDEGCDLLLITDGQVWEANAMVAAARRSGHRVFAIGVGSAPREGLLRRLAEASGGACEFATPGESLEQAMERSLRRIRQRPWHGLRVEWDVQPHDRGAIPSAAFGGDTVLLQATFTATAPRQARLFAVDPLGQEAELGAAPVQPACDPETLARMLAARRLDALEDNAEAATRLALSYRLLTPQTCCVVVHERAEGTKVLDAAKLHVVPPMLPAGLGTTVTVAASRMRMFAKPFARSSSTPPVCFDVAPSSPQGTMNMRFGKSLPAASDPLMDSLCQAVAELLAALAHAPLSAEEAAQRLRQANLPSFIEAAVAEMAKDQGLALSDAWLMLALWTSTHANDAALRSGEDAIAALLSPTAASIRGSAVVMLGRKLAPIVRAQRPLKQPTLKPDGASRSERLRRFLDAL